MLIVNTADCHGLLSMLISIAACTSAAKMTTQWILAHNFGEKSIAFLFVVAAVGGFAKLLISGCRLSLAV